MEAQRFPDDYNGIISGAPVNTFTRLHMGQLWTAHATLKTPGAVLSRDDLTLVNKAVVEQCDARTESKRGAHGPRTCHFQPKPSRATAARRSRASRPRRCRPSR